jgi:FkbM family methyltransferase
MPDWSAHGHDTTYDVMTELGIARSSVKDLDSKIKTIMCVGSLCGYEVGVVSESLPNAEVYVVEAVPETYKMFLSDSRPCCPAKAKTFCEVMSDTIGPATLFISHNNPCHSILPQVYGWVDTREVTTSTIKALSDRSGILPDFLMVDVEGATARVLLGAGEGILNHVTVVMAETEITKEVLFLNGDSDEEVDALLSAHGLRRVSKVIDPAFRQFNSVWVRGL